jgi:hypothetical protein
MHRQADSHEQRVIEMSTQFAEDLADRRLVRIEDFGGPSQTLNLEQETQNLEVTEADVPIIQFWNPADSRACIA